MSRVPKRLKIFLVFIIIIAGGYTGSQLTSSFSGRIPREFSEARLQGALIAEGIVNLSNRSAQDLENISELERNKNFSQALKTISDVVKQGQNIRNEAVKLSGELEKMTRTLSEIKSFEARLAAIEAISDQLALISRLINYSGYLGDLLDILRGRFEGTLPNSGSKIKLLVDQVNAEAKAINNFNAHAIKAMERFDAIMSK